MPTQGEQNTQENVAQSKSQISPIFISVLLTALITALLVGGGITLWKMYSSTEMSLVSTNESEMMNGKVSQTDENRVDGNIPVNGESMNLVDEECTIDGCLFEDKNNDAVVGFANIEGYYKTYDKLDWGDVEVVCDAIIVTGGNDALIDNFKKWIQDGNGLNSMSESGELILNINVSSLSPEDQSLIKSSTSENPVDLNIIRPKVLGTGVSACTSLVQIVDVK